MDREAMLNELPEPSPLAKPLPGLVVADDREAYANEHDFDYRDGAVKVEIELEPDGKAPEEYLVEVLSEYGRTIIAFVLVDDLVDLATDKDVRIVKPPTDSKTN